LTDLINYIDNQIKSCIGEARMFGLCHLLQDDNGVYPATVEQNPIAAFPDDRFLISVYHRLLNGAYEESEDFSFGKTRTGLNSQNVRTVVFIKLGEDQSKIDDIVNAFPDVFEMDDYRYISVSRNVSLLRDRDAIWGDEFSETYKDKYQVKFHIYALEWSLNYIKCNVCC
jgi:hypothetical protein